MIYRDRTDAGKQLSKKLLQYAFRDDVLVLALPRGGVPVAYEVAQKLNIPLDVFVVRKLGVPGQEELAMGAIATGDVRVLNEEVIDSLAIPQRTIDQVTAAQSLELHRREVEYRGDRHEPDIRGKTVILVDDGLATGSTMRAGIQALRQQQPARIVVAVPVSAPDTCEQYAMGADEIICGFTPEPFFGVGEWYQDFSQTTDDEVRYFLESARENLAQTVA